MISCLEPARRPEGTAQEDALRYTVPRISISMIYRGCRRMACRPPEDTSLARPGVPRVSGMERSLFSGRPPHDGHRQGPEVQDGQGHPRGARSGRAGDRPSGGASATTREAAVGVVLIPRGIRPKSLSDLEKSRSHRAGEGPGEVLLLSRPSHRGGGQDAHAGDGFRQIHMRRDESKGVCERPARR
jgi:hypothetical protein